MKLQLWQPGQQGHPWQQGGSLKKTWREVGLLENGHLQGA